MSVKNQFGYDSFPIPVGSIIPYAKGNNVTTIPLTYRICNGDLLLRTEYPQLFSAIGTIYGTTDATNFRVPNLGGRGNNTFPFIQGANAPNGTYTPPGAESAPQLLTNAKVPNLSSGNFAVLDPANATMANNVTHPAGWLGEGDNDPSQLGTNSPLVGAGSDEYRTATATLTSLDVTFQNGVQTPIDPVLTNAGGPNVIQFRSLNLLFLIKTYYELPNPPSPNTVQSAQSNPFPPQVVMPVKALSGFVQGTYVSPP
jgi:microcystin-dependent protein